MGMPHQKNSTGIRGKEKSHQSNVRGHLSLVSKVIRIVTMVRRNDAIKLSEINVGNRSMQISFADNSIADTGNESQALIIIKLADLVNS